MAARKKLLIAGGGYAEIPLIKAAKKLGYYVITSGNRADELGHRESDEYCPADFSNPQALLKIAIKNNISAICPCANDFSAISSAYVAEQLNLPGHDSYATTQLIHHKDRYRQFAQEHDIPSPTALGFSDINDAFSGLKKLRLPLMIKPVDLTGGKGVTRVETYPEAETALLNAFSLSKAGRVVVEEFLTGSRHGFSAFIREGKVVFHFSDNEYYYLNDYLVSAASTPSTVPYKTIEELIRQTERIAALLSLKTGIFHVQFIYHNSQPVIIEICRRPPGDLYIQLVQHATGFDYPAAIIKAFCGDDCSYVKQHDVTGFYTRHCIMPATTGILETVSISPKLQDHIIDSLFWWHSGEKVSQVETKKFGIVFLQFDSLKKMLEQTNKMQKLIKATIH